MRGSERELKGTVGSERLRRKAVTPGSAYFWELTPKYIPVFRRQKRRKRSEWRSLSKLTIAQKFQSDTCCCVRGFPALPDWNEHGARKLRLANLFGTRLTQSHATQN